MCRGVRMLEEGEIEEGEIEEEVTIHDDEEDTKPLVNLPPPLNPSLNLPGETQTTSSSTTLVEPPLPSPSPPPPPEADHAKGYRRALELVSSVTLKNACDCLASTCLQLYDALVILRKLPSEIGVEGLVSQIFGKILILFHLYEAVPKEKKLQAYANLIKLTTLFKESLFTEEQSTELSNLSRAIKPVDETDVKTSRQNVKHVREEVRDVQKLVRDKPVREVHKPELKPVEAVKPARVRDVEPKKLHRQPEVRKPTKPVTLPDIRPSKDFSRPGNKPAKTSAYSPWENRSDDITSAYKNYITTHHMQEEFPSPTPSEEDVAMRYGKSTSTQQAAAPSVLPSPLPQVAPVLPSPRPQLPPVEVAFQQAPAVRPLGSMLLPQATTVLPQAPAGLPPGLPFTRPSVPVVPQQPQRTTPMVLPSQQLQMTSPMVLPSQQLQMTSPLVLPPQQPHNAPMVPPQAVTEQSQPASQSQPAPVVLKSRDPRKHLVAGIAPNHGKPRVANIMKKRDAGAEMVQPDLKRLKPSPEVPKPATGTGGWLDVDEADEAVPMVTTVAPPPPIVQPVVTTMKARDPRRALVANNTSTPGLTTGLSQTEPEKTEAVLENGVAENGIHPELREILNQLDEAGRAAFQKERQRRIDEHEKMIGEKKLCLVLDLDHTLLNSAKFSEVEPHLEQFLQAANAMERKGPKELFRFPQLAMWTKLRPGIWKFLSRASELYEMHLYTMGNKAYATEMAKLLDPKGLMFAGRVISKGDDGVAVYGDEKLPKSKDLDGVLGMESAAIIIDDSSRVWPHHRDNLIVVERYMYFPSSRRQFGLSGPSLLEVGHDEREGDGTLASILGVIERIHFNVFQDPLPMEVDVRKVLAMEQRKILQGCRIVFSRIIPVGENQPELHPLWRSAEQFGAVCTTVLDQDVTHVVALAMGTDKVNWALSTGKYLVSPQWIEASTILYRRGNERDFPVPV